MDHSLYIPKVALNIAGVRILVITIDVEGSVSVLKREKRLFLQIVDHQPRLGNKTLASS